MAAINENIETAKTCKLQIIMFIFLFLSNCLKLRISNSFENLQHYKDVLDAYNICFQDEVLDLIENSTNEDYMIKSFMNKLDKFDVEENDILKRKSNLLIFLINKSYLNSELFKKHFKEALESTNDIIMLLLEEGCHYELAQYKKCKIYNFKMVEDIQFDEKYLLNDNLNELFSELKRILKKNKRVSL